MALSLLGIRFAKRSSILTNIQSKNVLSFNSSKNNEVKLFSSHAPAKKDNHSHEHSAKGHGDHKVPAEILEKYKKPHQEHLFPFEEGDYIPPTETHSVGAERLEIDFGPFDTTYLSGGFGTREKPIEVPSRFNFRIIGCTGSEEVEHEILWHEVKQGKDLLCMECGQCFRLARIPGFEDFGGHGHDDHHDEHPFSGHKDGEGFRYMYPPKTAAEKAAQQAERDEELKRDPKAPPKKEPSHGVDYHQFGQHEDTEQNKLASSSPVFQDRRPQPLKDRK